MRKAGRRVVSLKRYMFRPMIPKIEKYTVSQREILLDREVFSVKELDMILTYP